jgi:hypothetical protein
LHARGVAERRGNKGGANLLREPQAALGGDAETGGDGRGGEGRRVGGGGGCGRRRKGDGEEGSNGRVGFDLISE